MRVLFWIVFVTASAFAQDIDIVVRPDAVYVESVEGNIVPMERVFFHVVVENRSKAAIELEWIRFDLVNSKGILVSGQYSGRALMDLLDSSIDRKRIEPTTKQTLSVGIGERKAISDVFLDFPKGFIGENLIVEVSYKSQGKSDTRKNSVQVRRTKGFSERL